MDKKSGLLSVQRALEDEFDAAGLCVQWMNTERAGGVESMCAVGHQDLPPVHRCLLRADVTARNKGVCGRSCVHVEARLAAQPQRHVRAPSPTHGALPLLALLLHLGVPAPTPGVVTVHVAAAEVGPGLLLIQNVFASQARESECIEAHRALRPPGIQLLA